MPERSLSTISLLVASLLLTSMSAVAAYGEISPYFMGGISAQARFHAISGDSYRSGSSLWSKEMLLRDCLEVSQSIYAKAQPAARRKAFLDACDSEAASILVGMPGYARAWLVRASVAAEQGSREEFLRDLEQAHRTAPNVHWLAEQRSGLAEANFALLDPAAVKAYEQDLQTLLDSPQGVRVLAYRYTRRPEVRDRLKTLLEAEPAAVQVDFLGQVKWLSGT